jgi:uncharacterized protein (DUF2236 family)
MALSKHLMKVHADATGIEPVTGKRYSANNPASQLWIHVTGWHSVLKCYELYGPGRLSVEEEDRYWADCVVAAELQTCKPEDVPASRSAVRDYFADVRPTLCVTERAWEGMHYLLRTPRARGGVRLWAMSRLIAPATIASLPKWMRRVGGFDQLGLIDAVAKPATRAAVFATRSPRARLAVLAGTLPMTHRALRDHLYGEPPLRPETVTPAQARVS